MTDPGDLKIIRYEQTDRRLGRDVVHDPRSRGFAAPREIDLPTSSFRLRVFNPSRLPDQQIGCCTGCDAAVKMNTRGNRVRGVTFGMDDAIRIYSRASELDPWPGSYPPDDTGSSGLGAAQACKEAGDIDRYLWLFSGVDQVLTQLRAGHPVGIGARFDNNMFSPDARTGLVELGGGVAGGHQWTAIGFDKKLDAVEGLCWWGRWGLGGKGIFRIRRRDLADLLTDDGDAHITFRAGANG